MKKDNKWYLIGVSSCNRFISEEGKQVITFAKVQNVAYYQKQDWMRKILQKYVSVEQ